MRNNIFITFLLIILVGCDHTPMKPFIITGEETHYNGYSEYSYDCSNANHPFASPDSFIDSTNKYNIGDTIK
jgi:hypothetical protein